MSIHAIALAASEAAADATAAAAPSGLPQFDPASWPSQLFWLAVTFGGLYFLMSNYFLPRIGGMIEERRDRIADDLDKAAESKRQAEAAEAAYEQALADAKAKAQNLAAETRSALDEEIASLQKEAEATLLVKTTAAEARINEMTKNAADKVREAARDTTRAIVETLIDEAPSAGMIDEAVARAAKA